MKTSNQINLLSQSLTNSGLYVEASCGNVSAIICIHDHGIRVICQNAAHKAWSGMGRFFSSINDAMAGYKKQEMKDLITFANSLNH